LNFQHFFDWLASLYVSGLIYSAPFLRCAFIVRDEDFTAFCLGFSMGLLMLTKRQDFIRVKSGVAFGTQGFLLQAIAQDDLMTSARPPRFGITVSNHSARRRLSQKKQTGPGINQQDLKTRQKRGPISVLRNRMRRRLREALKLIAPRFAHDGIDYVVIGRPNLETLNFEILLKDLEKSFQKVHGRLISSNKHHSKP